MIKYLQRLRRNKGFTLIELIVVIAIIAVLSAIIISSFADDTSKRNAARVQAQDFYAAVQYNFTRYQKYDSKLVYNIETDPTAYIEYKMEYGGNYPTNDYTYIEMFISSGVIRWVHVEKNLTDLLGNFDAETNMTVLENRLMKDIDNTIDASSDGYYYALIKKENRTSGGSKLEKTTTVKVHSAYYSPDRLPVVSGTDYWAENLLFTNDNKLVNGQIMGVCSDKKSAGVYLGMPSSYFMCLDSDLTTITVEEAY